MNFKNVISIVFVFCLTVFSITPDKITSDNIMNVLKKDGILQTTESVVEIVGSSICFVVLISSDNRIVRPYAILNFIPMFHGIWKLSIGNSKIRLNNKLNRRDSIRTQRKIKAEKEITNRTQYHIKQYLKNGFSKKKIRLIIRDQIPLNHRKIYHYFIAKYNLPPFCSKI